ncbi:MAG: DUF6538 domain-containing protein, partial [Deltaproteobacteria bacterium]
MARCYILKTPANWFFRRKVPSDLRDKLGRREIKVSLKTGSKQEAMAQARALVAETDILFSTLRGKNMSKRIVIPGLTEIVVESTVTRADGSAWHRKMEFSEAEFMALIQSKRADAGVPTPVDGLLQQVED